MRRVLVVLVTLVSLLVGGATRSAADDSRHTAPRVPTGYAVDLAPVIHWYATALWDAHLHWNAVVAENAQRAAHATHAVTLRIVNSPRTLFNATGSVNGQPCGGDLPSCCTLSHESGGSPTARNASGAAGLWQFMPGTWNNYGGYASAADAPASVQNERARQVYAGGAGWGNWRGDGCYPGG